MMACIDDDNGVVFDRNGLAGSYNRNGFGSLCSNLNRTGIDEDDFTPELRTGMPLFHMKNTLLINKSSLNS